MNIEQLTQILDTVSFVMVTPEFMRDDTLHRIQMWSGKVVSSFSSKGLVLPAVVFYPVVATVFWLVVRWNILPGLPVAEDIKIWGLIAIVPVVVFVYGVAGVYIIAVRRRLFYLGALVFFGSRVLAIWFAKAG